MSRVIRGLACSVLVGVCCGVLLGGCLPGRVGVGYEVPGLPGQVVVDVSWGGTTQKVVVPKAALEAGATKGVMLVAPAPQAPGSAGSR
jgi:hypothetical protein